MTDSNVVKTEPGTQSKEPQISQDGADLTALWRRCNDQDLLTTVRIREEAVMKGAALLYDIFNKLQEAQANVHSTIKWIERISKYSTSVILTS